MNNDKNNLVDGLFNEGGSTVCIWYIKTPFIYFLKNIIKPRVSVSNEPNYETQGSIRSNLRFK